MAQDAEVSCDATWKLGTRNVLARGDSGTRGKRIVHFGVLPETRRVAASFFSWRRRLTQRDRNDTAGKFVPLKLDTRAMAMRPACEVVLSDGCRIIVPRQCDANWLGEILEALRGSSC